MICFKLNTDEQEIISKITGVRLDMVRSGGWEVGGHLLSRRSYYFKTSQNIESIQFVFIQNCYIFADICRWQHTTAVTSQGLLLVAGKLFQFVLIASDLLCSTVTVIFPS